jgi:hypothetical protein
LLTLNAAHAMIKVAVPNMACQVIDWAIQAHGGGGTSNDFGLAAAYTTARLLALPMDRTKFIATRLPGWSCGSTRIRILETGFPLVWFLEAASLYTPHEDFALGSSCARFRFVSKIGCS